MNTKISTNVDRHSRSLQYFVLFLKRKSLYFTFNLSSETEFVVEGSKVSLYIHTNEKNQSEKQSTIYIKGRIESPFPLA